MLIDSDKTAIINKGEDISYHTLLQKIHLFSLALDINKDDRVIIFSEPRVGYIYALFSIWECGGSYTSWFYNLDADAGAWAVKDIMPVAIFVSSGRYSLLQEILKKINFNVRILLIDELEKLPVMEDTPIACLQVNMYSILFRVYTAGITDRHKAVELTLSNLMYVVLKGVNSGYITNIDRTLVLLPLFNNWILISTILIPLLIGGCCVFCPKDDIHIIIDTIRSHNVSILVLVRRVYLELLDVLFSVGGLVNRNSIKYKLVSLFNNARLSRLLYKDVHRLLGNNIRYFLTVGAKLDNDIYEPLLALGFEIFEGYGMAETSSLITYPASKRTHPDYVGKIIDGLDYKMINNELILHGKSVGKQYFNRDLFNTELFNNGWFFTKDIVEIEDDGMVRFRSRFNEEIILKTGHIIIPAEIEDLLNSRVDYVIESGVFYQDDILKVVIVPSKSMIEKYGGEENYLIISSIIRWKVIEYYNRSVPRYKRINKIIITENRFKRSTSGKIKRYLLYDYEEIEIEV